VNSVIEINVVGARELAQVPQIHKGGLTSETQAAPRIEFDLIGARVLPVAMQPVRIVPHRPVPRYLHDFVNAVRKIDGVKCVIAEDGEDSVSVHISTFAERIDDQLRDHVYEAEADAIERNDKVMFDFHLRRIEDAAPATAGSTRHVFMIWGALDANGS